MISRELQANQPILSALSKQPVSFSKNETNVSSFDAVLSQKQTQAHPVDAPTDLSHKEVNADRKDGRVNQYVKKNEERTASSKDSSKVQEKHSKSDQDQTKAVDQKTDTSDHVDADEALKKLKKILKKKTGLSDEMIDQLLQMMPMNMEKLAQMIDSQKLEQIDVSPLTDLANDKQSLEVTQLLDQPMELSDLKQLLSDFLTVIQSFKDILKEEFVSQNQISNEDIAKAFAEAIGSEDLKVQVDKGAENQTKNVDIKALIESMGNQSDKTAVEAASQESASGQSMKDSKEGQMDMTLAVEDNKAEVGISKDSKPDEGNLETKTTVEVKGDQIVVQTTTGPNQTNMTTSSQVIQTMTLPKADIMNQVLEAVKNNMSLKLGNEGSQMVVKLQPEALGKVDVKVSIHKGVVLAEIHVENEAVKATVESNLDHLKHSLSQKGYQVNQLSVGLNSGQKEHSGDSVFDRYEQMKKNNKSSKIEALDEDILNDLAQDVSRLTSSTIDYFA